MASLIDSSGVINSGLVAHVQSMSVNKTVQAQSVAAELSQEALENIATGNVQKEYGQIGKTTSSQALSQLHDEEKQKSPHQELSQKNQEEVEEEEKKESPSQSNSPFVGNLLNIKI